MQPHFRALMHLLRNNVFGLHEKLSLCVSPLLIVTLSINLCHMLVAAAAVVVTIGAATTVVVAAKMTTVVKPPLVPTQIMVGKTYPVALL